MKDRAQSAARVARLRAQMARLAEWRHLKAEQTLQAVTEAKADLDKFAAEFQPTGALARTVIGQTVRLSRRQALAVEARERSRTAYADAQRDLKVADTVAERLTREADAQAERRQLERLIERFAGDTSLP